MGGCSFTVRADARRRVLWLGGALSVLAHAWLLWGAVRVQVPAPRPAATVRAVAVRWLPVPVVLTEAAPPRPQRRWVDRSVAAMSAEPPAAPRPVAEVASAASAAEPASPPLGVALAPVALGGWGGAGWGRRGVALAAVDDAAPLSARLHGQAQARLQAQALLAQQAQAEALARAVAISGLLAEASQQRCDAAAGDPHSRPCDGPLPR